ncbi:MAG: HIT domain-containing protein [Ilumatobacter sp.]|nr:HIT domain-containing protein [Ilumatobacter sp.]
MVERIWSGWRAAYVGDAADRRRDEADGATGSVFTEVLASGLPDEETFIVHRGDHVFAILNIYPYTSGHLLVVPYREVADLADLTDAETAEFWATVTHAIDVVRRAYIPDGLNVGMNIGRAAGGSITSHLHMHVVPRWTGDSNFVTAIANAQTLPEPLAASAARLRSVW